MKITNQFPASWLFGSGTAGQTVLRSVIVSQYFRIFRGRHEPLNYVLVHHNKRLCLHSKNNYYLYEKKNWFYLDMYKIK